MKKILTVLNIILFVCICSKCFSNHTDSNDSVEESDSSANVDTLKSENAETGVPKLSSAEDSIITSGDTVTRRAKHEFIDLGLSVLWATTNIGANNPESVGYYFAWGEHDTKTYFVPENSLSYGEYFSNIEGNPKYDAASFLWGEGWRMPTSVEFKELFNYCEFTKKDGGYLVESPNGNTIYLPATGYRRDTPFFGDELYMDDPEPHYDDNLFYWSASITDKNNTGYSQYFLVEDQFSYDGNQVKTNGERHRGMCIRPVKDKDTTKKSKKH